MDNAFAYRQVEELNIGLEAKVLERTAALEKVNQELQTANEQLRELNHLKSAFVSTVSHELRTPMTSIKAYAENMLDGLAGPVTDKQRNYLNRINFNAQRLTRMINDLLDLSRIESGRSEICLFSVSVPEVVADVVESLQTIAQEKFVVLTERHQNPLPMILGDKDKLHQILTNLIHNAIKFTPKHGEVIVMSEYRQDGFVQICVSDTGCGIPPQEIPKVFDKFYRGESAPAEVRGAGLGLAIAKSLVELHAGRIWVESVPGRGSRFCFTVPAIQ
jgi:signal transduction histidine kinase